MIDPWSNFKDIPTDDEIVYVGSRRCSARVISQSVQQTLRQIRKNQVATQEPDLRPIDPNVCTASCS